MIDLSFLLNTDLWLNASVIGVAAIGIKYIRSMSQYLHHIQDTNKVIMRHIKIINHNSAITVKALLKQGILSNEDIAALELSSGPEIDDPNKKWGDE